MTKESDGSNAPGRTFSHEYPLWSTNIGDPVRLQKVVQARSISAVAYYQFSSN